MNPLRWPLYLQIFAALALAAGFGVPVNVWGLGDSVAVGWILGAADFIGTVFMNALRMVVVPLVAASVIAGIIGMGGQPGFARLGFKTVVYYTVSGMVAILIGLVLVNVIRPGVVSPEVAQAIVGQAERPAGLAESTTGRGAGDLSGIFLRMFPVNIVAAATDNGQLLGIITFSILFGFFAARLPDGPRVFQRDLWESVQSVMMAITELIIRFAPIGVFGLVAPLLARTGFDVLRPLGWFVLTVVLALAIHFFVVLGLALKWLGRVRPSDHFRAMAPVLATAFSTASSAATLPVTLDTVEKSAGVTNRVASFTLPLGATVNMDGTALYECVVVIFIAQIFGVLHGFDLTLAMQVNIVLLALLTSIGVAGIPSASLVAIAIILTAVGLPIEAVGLVWVSDRILDMCRTAVNVFSDTVGAIVIARSEGESPYAHGSPADRGLPARHPSADATG